MTNEKQRTSEATEKRAPKSSLLRSFLLLLRIFNGITLPIISILAVGFYLKGIPLTYLLGYAGALFVSASVISVFRKESLQEVAEKEWSKEPWPVLLAGTNLLVAAFLHASIVRNKLSAFELPIILLTLVLLNLAFLEIRTGYARKLLARFWTYLTTAPSGKFLSRSFLLLVVSLSATIVADQKFGAENSAPKRLIKGAKSEIAGTFDTLFSLDTNSSGAIRSEAVKTAIRLERPLVLGSTGTDVMELQQALSERRLYSGAIDGKYNASTAAGLNTYIAWKTGKKFTNPEADYRKIDSLTVKSSGTHEVSGTISTGGSGQVSVPVQKIVSEDGKAIATIDQGKITIEVMPQKPEPQKVATGTKAETKNSTGSGSLPIETAPLSSSGTNSASGTNQAVQSNPNVPGAIAGGSVTPASETKVWTIASRVSSGGKWALYGVVIGLPKVTPAPGQYGSFQLVAFSADGASSVAFTLDGSTPECGNSPSETQTDLTSITIKARACYNLNQIPGPVGTYTYVKK